MIALLFTIIYYRIGRSIYYLTELAKIKKFEENVMRTTGRHRIDATTSHSPISPSYTPTPQNHILGILINQLLLTYKGFILFYSTNFSRSIIHHRFRCHEFRFGNVTFNFYFTTFLFFNLFIFRLLIFLSNMSFIIGCN